MDYNNINFTEEELFKLNIHELRTLARDIGVPSPTTKQKDELVASTLAIVYGEAPKADNKAKAGRPARKRVKPSKLLFATMDLDLDEVQDIENPFVKMYENNKDKMFNLDNDDKQTDYLKDLFNPYTKSKVASSHVEYQKSSKNVEIENKEDIVFMSDLEKAAKRMREVLGRGQKNEVMENDIDLKDSMFVSGYVFLGAENKLYITSPEDDRENQVIYLIPRKLAELFALCEGDYISGWADENIDVVLTLSSINGHIVE